MIYRATNGASTAFPLASPNGKVLVSRFVVAGAGGAGNVMLDPADGSV
jgi:hypothetical protein